jgi:hypothetical protein
MPRPGLYSIRVTAPHEEELQRVRFAGLPART